jgi:hypothetical protein
VLLESLLVLHYHSHLPRERRERERREREAHEQRKERNERAALIKQETRGEENTLIYL